METRGAHRGPPRAGCPHHPAAVALRGSRCPPEQGRAELCSRGSRRGRDLPRSSSIEAQSQAGPGSSPGFVTGTLRTGGACWTNPADGVHH